MQNTRKLFVNLAVEDRDRSVELFTALGFSFDPRFTDENATCMLIGEDAYATLLTKPRFADFSTKNTRCVDGEVPYIAGEAVTAG